MYGSWDMEPNRQNVFVILGHLLSLYPTNNQKNQNFEKNEKKKTKNKKKSGYIIILHQYTANNNHMMYGS